MCAWAAWMGAGRKEFECGFCGGVAASFLPPRWGVWGGRSVGAARVPWAGPACRFAAQAGSQRLRVKGRPRHPVRKDVRRCREDQPHTTIAVEEWDDVTQPRAARHRVDGDEHVLRSRVRAPALGVEPHRHPHSGLAAHRCLAPPPLPSRVPPAGRCLIGDGRQPGPVAFPRRGSGFPEPFHRPDLQLNLVSPAFRPIVDRRRPAS